MHWFGVDCVFVLLVSLPVYCVGVDRECLSYSKPGDIVIGGLFPIHYIEGPGKCTEAQSRWGTMLSEAMIFAVERLNRRQDILPNITVGYDIRDDCRADDIALWHALDLINALNPDESSGICQPQQQPDATSNVIGIVGTSETLTSVVVAKAASLYKVPLVSYSASGDELGDNLRFPYFFRTVPQNLLEVQAIVDILRTFDWVYVSLLHSTVSDYLHSSLIFQEIAPIHDICVAYSAAIRPTAKDKEVDQIVATLNRYPKAKAVVIIGDKFTGLRVLQASKKAGMTGRYQWVGGSRWGYLAVENGLDSDTDGAIFVRSHQAGLDSFADFASAKEPVEPHVSPWYKDLAMEWMEDNKCTNITECPLRAGNSEGPVVNSVNAIAVAFHDLLEETCANSSLCNISAIVDLKDMFLEKLFAVTFTGADGNTIQFDSSGNSGGRFSVTNYRQGEGEVDVGLWVSGLESIGERLNLSVDGIRFVNKSLHQPLSVCTEECLTGYIVVPLEEKCCWGCKKCLPRDIVINRTLCHQCPDREWPDEQRAECVLIIPSTIAWTESSVVVILAMSGLGMILCGLVIAGLFMFNNHPLIKASSRELSSISVVGLTITFGSCLVLITKPTLLSCLGVELVLAMSTTLIYGPTLLKVNRIYRIFRKARKSTQRPRFISPKHQVIACLILIAIQVLISVFSAILAPSTPAELVSFMGKPRIELYCSFGSGFIASCVYNLLIILTCCIFAFWTRKVPSNYNESKFIGISVYSTLVMCLAAVPVYATAAATLQKVASVSFAVILNAYLTLVCLYLPKIYAVKFVNSDDMSTSDWRGTLAKAGSSMLTSNQVGPSTSGINDSKA